MAARAYWSGRIRLALVSIPVEVVPATKSAARIAFHQVHEPSGKRIRYEKVVPGIGPVDTDDIVKGYEVEKGKYVLLTDEVHDHDPLLLVIAISWGIALFEYLLQVPANRIGYAVQLCYLRHPGRALSPGEAPPAAMLELFGEQVGGSAVEFGRYAERAPTLREHRAEIEAYLGLRPFERPDLRAMLALGIEVATSTDCGEPIVAAMVERLRHLRVVVPAASTLERVALIARAQARRVAHAGLIRDLTPEQEAALMGLIAPGEQGRTGLGWVRDWSEAPTSANFKAVVERLDRVRSLEVEPDRARRIHAARYAVIARVAGIVTAQALRRMERRRRLATMVAFAIELA